MSEHETIVFNAFMAVTVLLGLIDAALFIAALAA